MTVIADRIAQLRQLMMEQEMAMYVVPTADFHQSEYVGEHFKERAFITGFDGSAGTAVICLDQAGLWTDGRYFLAAEEQLKGSGVTLYKMGEPGVPTIAEFIEANLQDQGTLGFDGRVVSMEDGLVYQEIVTKKSGRILYDTDLIDSIWTDRPALSTEPAFHLEEQFSGESTASKLTRLREAMTDMGANTHIMTSLDDICWLLNIRGNDIDFFPMVLSYAVITPDKVELFIDASKLDETIMADFKANHVIVNDYNGVYDYAKTLTEENVLLVDPIRMNFALQQDIPTTVRVIEATNPTVVFKAIKNPVEIANMKQAQLKDGVAHTRYMYWLKHNVGKKTITEMSATEQLEAFRKEQEGYIRQSFEPITAFGEHGAIVHYSASEESNKTVTPGSFLLSDTGAGFLQGSTDISRTFALGEVTEEMKRHYTTTLKSHIRLSQAVFLHGVNGVNLDILARQPFWEQGLNYNHGTGHGVGYLLNIHESPIGIRWQYRSGESHPFEEGMVVTNEPGVYIAGSHGVRLENELLVQKGIKNEYGQFMHFESITYVPFDRDAILPELLSTEDINWLNAYHEKVYGLLVDLLPESEQTWLKAITQPL